MEVMLPDLMWVLQYGNKAIKIKALVVFRNVMAQLERKEATPMAVLLAEFLPPFFDDVRLLPQLLPTMAAEAGGGRWVAGRAL